MSRLARILAVVALTLAAVVVAAVPALAGSPHFVGAVAISRSGDTLTVSGKVAGLGDEDQINVAVTADAQCVNRGGQEPQAENKGATLASGVFPVQNGKALFSLSGSAQTDPRCNPPMTLVYRNVTVTVSSVETPASFTAFTASFPGPF